MWPWGCNTHPNKTRISKSLPRKRRGNLAPVTTTVSQMAGTALGAFSARPACPFPPRLRTSMEFYDGFNIATPASGDTYSSAERTFRLNSVYQPDPSNSVRPLGFSTLAGIYARYRVDRCRIQISGHSAGDEAWIVAAVVGPSSTVSTNGISSTVAGANPFMAQMMIEKAANGTPQSYIKIEKEFSIAQLMGLTQKEYEAQWDRVTGTDTTNPTAGFIPYLLLNAANRGLSAAINVAFAVRLIYDVTWFERDVLLA